MIRPGLITQALLSQIKKEAIKRLSKYPKLYPKKRQFTMLIEV